MDSVAERDRLFGKISKLPGVLGRRRLRRGGCSKKGKEEGRRHEEKEKGFSGHGKEKAVILHKGKVFCKPTLILRKVFLHFGLEKILLVW